MKCVLALLAIVLASGCGGVGVKIDHVSCDHAGPEPTLLVWCNTVRLGSAPEPVLVHVEWNGYEGVGGLDGNEAPEMKRGSAVTVSRIGAFAPSESDYRLANSMRIRVRCGARLLTQRLIPPPLGLPVPGTTVAVPPTASDAPPQSGPAAAPATAPTTAAPAATCAYCGLALPPGAKECPSCGAPVKNK
jgi:hypothetical protein